MSLNELKKAYSDTLKIDFNGNSSGRWWSMSTYFETPAASIFRDLVDLEDSSNKHHEDVNFYNRDYSAHAEAIYNAMWFNYAEWGKGHFFREITTNPDKYLFKQPHVKQWLQELKNVHKRFLFLLTNSLPEYTDMLMVHSFGKDWTRLFDIVSVHAKKPIFFTQNMQYYEFAMVPHDEKDYPGPTYPVYTVPLETLQIKEGLNLFLGGNYGLLSNSIASLANIKGRNPKNRLLWRSFEKRYSSCKDYCKMAYNCHCRGTRRR